MLELNLIKTLKRHFQDRHFLQQLNLLFTKEGTVGGQFSLSFLKKTTSIQITIVFKYIPLIKQHLNVNFIYFFYLNPYLK